MARRKRPAPKSRPPFSAGTSTEERAADGEDPSSPRGAVPRYANLEKSRFVESPDSPLSTLPPLPNPPPARGVVLERNGKDQLTARLLGDKAPGAVTVDFTAERFIRRLNEGKKGLLGRATGIAKGETPTVWDATCGFGRDALQLATLGARVTAFERDPVVHALCVDGLERMRAVEIWGLDRSNLVRELPEAARERLTIVAKDACTAFEEAIEAGVEPPDVVLLDPMFPERGAALAKKEAQMLVALCGEGGKTDDDRALFEAARRLGPKRIVVKRPRHAPPLVDVPAPAHQFEGKSVRLDLYLPETSAAT